MCLADRPVFEPNAAGIDVVAREMFVAVPPGRDKNPVRVFATFTEDLERLADWLLQCGVTTVAMESTGCIGFHSTRSWSNEESVPV
jgi:transposase